jgi:hypothetical protein
MKTLFTLPSAFQTKRVAQSVVSVNQQVVRAISLTRFDQVKSSEPELMGSTLPELPYVTAIEPNEATYEDRAKVLELAAAGENLANVREVLLIQSATTGPWTASAHRIRHSQDPEGNPDGKSFVAYFENLKSAPPGRYNLQLTDEVGQTASFNRIFTVHAPVERPPGPGKKTGLELGAIIPNGSIEDTTIPAALVILRGLPSEFYVTDLDDKRQKGWRVEKAHMKDVAERFEWAGIHSYAAHLHELYEKAEIIFLTITIPAGSVGKHEFRRIYKLHAAATHPEGEDALAFFVRRDLKTTH